MSYKLTINDDTTAQGTLDQMAEAGWTIVSHTVVSVKAGYHNAQDTPHHYILWGRGTAPEVPPEGRPSSGQESGA